MKQSPGRVYCVVGETIANYNCWRFNFTAQHRSLPQRNLLTKVLTIDGAVTQNTDTPSRNTGYISESPKVSPGCHRLKKLSIMIAGHTLPRRCNETAAPIIHLAICTVQIVSFKLVSLSCFVHFFFFVSIFFFFFFWPTYFEIMTARKLCKLFHFVACIGCRQ